MLLSQFQKIVYKVEALWCEVFHDQPMWPINGRYQCRTCLRYTAVPWEAASTSSKVTPAGPANLQIVRARSASASRV